MEDYILAGIVSKETLTGQISTVKIYIPKEKGGNKK